MNRKCLKSELLRSQHGSGVGRGSCFAWSDDSPEEGDSHEDGNIHSEGPYSSEKFISSKPRRALRGYNGAATTLLQPVTHARPRKLRKSVQLLLISACQGMSRSQMLAAHVKDEQDVNPPDVT